MTPATEAGPTTRAGRALAITHPQLRERVLYIEAEARRTALFRDDYAKWMYEQGRADALREAAERVRALDTFNSEMIWAYRRHVLVILEPDTASES